MIFSNIVTYLSKLCNVSFDVELKYDIILCFGFGLIQYLTD